MRHQQWRLYAIALAVLVVGLVALGLPASTLLVAGPVLVRPMMMLSMMRGMHGDHWQWREAAWHVPRVRKGIGPNPDSVAAGQPGGPTMSYPRTLIVPIMPRSSWSRMWQW
jgi:hypothetical protein